MKFSSMLLFLLPAAGLLAQDAPKPPASRPPASLAPANPAVASPSVPGDRVIISVGDTKITAAQFNAIIETLPEQVRAQARGPRRKDFAENLVRIYVLAQDGKSLKVDQSPEYQAQSQFQAANLLAGKTFTEIAENIKLDQTAERAYYDAHKKDFEEVHARHILIRAAGSPMPLGKDQKELTDAEALAKAQEVRKKLDAGADFAKLASEESDDTGSKVNGGDLNFFKHGQMVGPFEEAAFSLKVGEVSQPVKTQFGYHIIKVEGRKGFDEAKAEVEKRMRSEQAQKELETMEKSAKVTLDPEFFGAAAAPTPAVPGAAIPK